MTALRTRTRQANASLVCAGPDQWWPDYTGGENALSHLIDLGPGHIPAMPESRIYLAPVDPDAPWWCVCEDAEGPHVHTPPWSTGPHAHKTIILVDTETGRSLP